MFFSEKLKHEQNKQDKFAIDAIAGICMIVAVVAFQVIIV